MKTVKPDYYDNFICIADRCEYTCCRDWEIAVDPAAEARWKKLGLKTGKLLYDGIGGRTIKLNRNGTCPFLRKDGLCTLVREHGEEMISDTCHTFPRETHCFPYRTEYTLTMGCPEALRLLWQKDSFGLTEYSDGPSGEDRGSIADRQLLMLRGRLSDLMQDRSITVAEVIRTAFLQMTRLYEKYGECGSIGDAADAFLDVQSVSGYREAVSAADRDEYDHICEQNELFLDLAENYRKKGIYADVLEPLAAEAEKFEAEDAAEEFLHSRESFEKVWNAPEMERKLRLLFAEEVYSTFYLPEGDMYMSILKLEWMGIFYAALKQCLFLEWNRTGGLTGESVSRITVTLIRMTGYSEDDIEEYLEDSFESAVWDYGYMAFIV